MVKQVVGQEQLTLKKHDAHIRITWLTEEPKINVVKRSSVSTGQLKRLLALHRQPINLVVFQGTLES